MYSFFEIFRKRRKDLKEQILFDRRNPMSHSEVEKEHLQLDTIEYLSILAKLELSEEEKKQVQKDMDRMLSYIDKLKELDTTEVEPMSHVFPTYNVFREDMVVNENKKEEMLLNAPVRKNNSFQVPKTI